MSFFFFDFICSPAGFKVSAEILEGLFISWCVWTTMAMRASWNIPKKDNTMWRMALHRQQSVRNNKKEDESVGSKSSHASADSDEKTWPISRYICWLQMKNPPYFWSRILHTHAASYQKHRAAAAHSLWKNIRAASFCETQSLFPFFLESAFWVSHQNWLLCWSFHQAQVVWKCACKDCTWDLGFKLHLHCFRLHL